MEKLNSFFLKLVKNPALLWKLGASLIFIAFAAVIFIQPTLIAGFSDSTGIIFAAVLLAWGVFRFFAFYMEYKRTEDE